MCRGLAPYTHFDGASDAHSAFGLLVDKCQERHSRGLSEDTLTHGVPTDHYWLFSARGLQRCTDAQFGIDASRVGFDGRQNIAFVLQKNIGVWAPPQVAREAKPSALKWSRGGQKWGQKSLPKREKRTVLRTVVFGFIEPVFWVYRTPCFFSCF